MSDFTYVLPFSEEKLLFGILAELKRKNELDLYTYLQGAVLSVEELGTSYYVDGSPRSRWDAIGVNIKFAVNPVFLDSLDNTIFKRKLTEICESFIPSEAGFDIKGIVFIPDLSKDFEASADIDVLSNIDVLSSEAIQVLSEDIKSKLQEDKPELALDRLHTFSVRFLRELCNKHGIEFVKKDALHTLLANYRKYLIASGKIQSDMTLQIIRANTNILNNYNNVRNDESYAHDNTILNKSESRLICNHVISLLKFIDEIEGLSSSSQS